MAPSRPESHHNLNYTSTSQSMPAAATGSNPSNDPPTATPIKPPFGSPNGLSSAGGSLGSTRLGAGSPSHELGGRLYSKRAREIQAQEGVSPGIWGPPTSGNSTPLRENIPESPSQDGFPDLIPTPEGAVSSPARRARAGTVPSRFSPVGTINGVSVQQSYLSKTSRPTPTTSPFRPQGVSGVDSTPKTVTSSAASNPAMLSRLRAGSMPQRASLLGAPNPFGPSLFSTNWSAAGRERAITLTSIRSSEGPTSPAQSSFSRDGLTDTDVKTLDYLGLAETPQRSGVTLTRSSVDALMQQQQQQPSTLPPLLAELAMMKSNNRFRSYSVNAKEKYAEDDEEYGGQYAQLPSGTLTPSAAATAAQLAATQAQIHQHNLAVQAFANQASRPRARTAGVLDTPPQRSSIRNYLATPSRLDSSINVADLHISESGEYEELSEAVHMMQLGGSGTANLGIRPTAEMTDENNLDGPTRALWIGSIPVSTTVTSLDAIFSLYGKVESTRVLTHKNCGFVNYERLESAIQAKSFLNGKEIFPGAGPVRIGYAKVPGTSASGTPGANGSQLSPTPDPNAARGPNGTVADGADGSLKPDRAGAGTPQVPALVNLQPEIALIVKEFGASDDDTRKISTSIQRAIAYLDFENEIPPIPEPSQTRMHDAPRLRDIRKRIDNEACSMPEIEETANGMLPEITELSSDYLGNTVVQKLFEFCSEPTKEQMLAQVASHLAEIGVHKNGTWAAQKIIDVAKTPTQMKMIVESLRPYTVPLFLDQYGNYVLQCCLRFGNPFNDFIFETMLSKMWEVAQGRFGARAMRACLESHHASKDQQRMLAAAIALHSVQLATNANGALLLTWFLDTCTFPRRRTVLAPRLVPHLVHLCTHKVAYLTVLKVINQRNEPEAREIVLKALFFSPGDDTLEKILNDPASGATLIFKVLTTPFFDESMRAEVVKNVSKVLTKLKAVPNQGYKRLMDEVGLSSRGTPREHHPSRDGTTGHASNAEKQQHRPTSRQANPNYRSQPAMERQYSGQFVPSMHPQNSSDNSPSLPRPVSSEQNVPSSFEQHTHNSVNGFGSINPAGGAGGLGNLGNVSGPGFKPDSILPVGPQQMQYQAFLQSRGVSPGVYSGMAGNGFGGYTVTPAMDSFRGLQTHTSPLPGPSSQIGNPVLNQPAFAPPQFSPVLNATQMYPYPPQFYPQAQTIPNQTTGGRHGRR